MLRHERARESPDKGKGEEGEEGEEGGDGDDDRNDAESVSANWSVEAASTSVCRMSGMLTQSNPQASEGVRGGRRMLGLMSLQRVLAITMERFVWCICTVT